MENGSNIAVIALLIKSTAVWEAGRISKAAATKDADDPGARKRGRDQCRDEEYGEKLNTGDVEEVRMVIDEFAQALDVAG